MAKTSAPGYVVAYLCNGRALMLDGDTLVCPRGQYPEATVFPKRKDVSAAIKATCALKEPHLGQKPREFVVVKLQAMA